MMMFVMTGSYHPIAKPRVNKPARKHFPPHVIGDTHHCLDRQNKSKHAYVDRHQKYQRWNNDGTSDRFDQVEAHGSPCGWPPAVMMYRMRQSEQRWPMHCAMRPVEPRVLRKQINHCREGQIPQGVLERIEIHLRPAQVAPTPEGQPCGYPINCS